MKKNWFRHKRDLFDAGEERIIRKPRIFYAILTVLYLAAVMAIIIFGVWGPGYSAQAFIYFQF